MNPFEDKLEPNSTVSDDCDNSDNKLPRFRDDVDSPMDNAKSEGHGEAKQPSKEMTPLPEDFKPGESDVICGRGRNIWNFAGNVRFRRLIESRVDEYSAAKTKLDKSSILSSIVAEIRTLSPNGGFVKQDSETKRWYEVGDFLSREKVSQSFRDALHDRYRSSNKTKKRRRLEEQEKSAVINSTMQEIALEQLQSGKTDKKLYEIICQQQSLLEANSDARPHSTQLRQDSSGGGLVSKPDTRLSDMNVTAPFPPVNVAASASLPVYQANYGNMAHASGTATSSCHANQLRLDLSTMHNYPSHSVPRSEERRTLPNTMSAYLPDSSALPRSFTHMPSPPQDFDHAQFQGSNASSNSNLTFGSVVASTQQQAPSISDLAVRLSEQAEDNEDNPFEPVPLRESRQTGGQSLPDDIDSIFDDS